MDGAVTCMFGSSAVDYNVQCMMHKCKSLAIVERHSNIKGSLL